jgi:serine-type D-Ala-D-Ala carboxypeptidase/endopeptidase
VAYWTGGVQGSIPGGEPSGAGAVRFPPISRETGQGIAIRGQEAGATNEDCSVAHRALAILLLVGCVQTLAPRGWAVQGEGSQDAPVLVEVPADRTDFADQVQRASALCEELLGSQIVPGLAVGLVTPGHSQTLCFGVRRFASAQDAVADPITSRTLFEIGSLTKVFTGILLAEATVRDAVHLHDPVSDHLPQGWILSSASGADGPEPIRLWHLSTHTAGLPRVPLQLLAADPQDPYRDYDAAALQKTLAALELKRAPGVAYGYSNLGAGLLGFCLAGDASALDQANRQRILEPLGLFDTCIRLSAEQEARFAGAHGEGGFVARPWVMEALAGAGALRSSVEDLTRFVRIELDPAAWLAETPGATVSPEQREQLLAALELAGRQHWQSPEQPQTLALGLGWHLNPLEGTRWHNGQTGGFHSFVALQPEAGVGVVVLANAASPWVDRLGGRLLDVLLGQTVEPLAMEHPIALPQEAYIPLVGDYSMGGLRSMRVFVEPAGLFCQLNGEAVQRLYPRSALEYYLQTDGQTLRFLPDSSGRVDELLLLQAGKERRGRRK